MSRKPIITYAGGKGPRQQIWEAIRALKSDVWTRDMMIMLTNVEEGTVASYILALGKAGIVEVARREKKTNVAFTCWYRLVKDEGLEAPRIRKDGTRVTQGLAQEQMWRTLRLLVGDTNTRELIAHASTAAVPVAHSAANDYLQVLANAGYLICTAKGKGTGNGGVQARYRLKPSRNTGPRPPMVCRTRIVYDPNEDKVVWQPTVTDEDAYYGN